MADKNEQRLRIHVSLAFLRTRLCQPILVIFFCLTPLASQLAWVSIEEDAVVYAWFGVSGEVSVQFKHFLNELCFLKFYYKLPPKQHVVQVTHVFFLPVHIDLFASVLTRSTGKVSFILVNNWYQRESQEHSKQNYWALKEGVQVPPTESTLWPNCMWMDAHLSPSPCTKVMCAHIQNADSAEAKRVAGNDWFWLISQVEKNKSRVPLKSYQGTKSK